MPSTGQPGAGSVPHGVLQLLSAPACATCFTRAKVDSRMHIDGRELERSAGLPAATRFDQVDPTPLAASFTEVRISSAL